MRPFISDILDHPAGPPLIALSIVILLWCGIEVLTPNTPTETKWESVGNRHDHMWCYKVPGGWLYMQYNESRSTVFIPETVTSTAK